MTNHHVNENPAKNGNEKHPKKGIEKPANEDIQYSKQLYKDASQRVTKAYIIMISFVLVFLFGAFLPYFNIQHQREGSLSDSILNDLAKLGRLTLQQENISKSIQNRFDAPTQAAMNDYQRLDDYFRKLELIRSEAIASSSNLSVSQLETLVPTFFVCNQQFQINITNWVTCNAKFAADSMNKKIIIRYQPLTLQIEPLAKKAKENLDAFNLIAMPLLSENNKEVITKLPSSVDPESWRSSISNSLGVMKTMEANSNSILKFVSYNKSAQSLAWEVLNNPSGFRLAYTDQHRKDFNNVVNLLNQSKNEIKNAMKTLSEKFEEVEVPVLGTVPLGLANVVIIYPAAVGFGCLICLYYLGETISRRKMFENKLGSNLDRDLYPLWVDPDEGNRIIRYGRLILFIILPILILFTIMYLLTSNPIKDGSIFGTNENSILIVSVITGILLTILGVAMLIIKERDYNREQDNE